MLDLFFNYNTAYAKPSAERVTDWRSSVTNVDMKEMDMVPVKTTWSALVVCDMEIYRFWYTEVYSSLYLSEVKYMTSMQHHNKNSSVS